ncbi:AraC family transcriptional regulator [Sinorhizobium chiapasense]|uniref:AraC family transcriptional regulator n=1 Tax=Sinorhizobium chiapasense TaxID=501572 RepID=A0ABZ2B9J7_9HYPH
MQDSEAYGDRFGDKFGLETAPVFITRTLRNAEIAVTEIRSDYPRIGLTDSIAREDGYLVGLQIRDYPHHEYWEDGRQAPLTSLRSGDSVFYDLKRDPLVLIDKPFHSMHFYLPRVALNAIADDTEAPQIGELAYQPGAGVPDPVIADLGLSLLGAFGRPEEVSRVFVDHVTLAVGVHVAHRYGGMRVLRRERGQLAMWQEKRAKELLEANLDGDISLRALAMECGLSRSHFTRAFRATTGVAPHQWLLQRRIERAKDLLHDTKQTIAEVALSCGFADQSHFTRIFTRVVGTSPHAWRQSVNS